MVLWPGSETMPQLPQFAAGHKQIYRLEAGMRCDSGALSALRRWALISRLLTVAHGQDCDEIVIESIAHHIAALPERNEPIAKLLRHVFNWPPNRWIHAERLRALTDGSDRSPRRVAVFR